MTDRLKGVIVTFERDIREDDVQPLIAAIEMLRGVASVRPEVMNFDDLMARERVRSDMRAGVLRLLDELRRSE